MISHLETTQLYSSWAWHEVIFPSLILMSVICPFVWLMILNQSAVADLDTLPAPALVGSAGRKHNNNMIHEEKIM